MKTNSQRISGFLQAAIIIQISFYLVVIIDIPIIRQILGFIYLTLIPGFAIIHLLNLNLEPVESVVFAVGLSIAFLMMVGFLMNLLIPLLGLSQPLSLIFLMTVIGFLTTILLLLSYSRSHGTFFFFISSKTIITLLVALVAPILSVLGAILVNVPPHSNNSVLLFMLLFIAILAGLVAFFKKTVSSQYPLILYMVALALLLHTSLFSNHLCGGDIFGEYSTYRLTVDNLFWDPNLASRLHAMLSITILPTIYSLMLGLEGTWIFKIVYPLIFAIVPLGLYLLFKSKVEKEIAFFSTFFFMSNMIFFTELLQLARQMVGELFYMLLFLSLFKDKIKPHVKWVFFIIFSFGLIVSHYALSYIFLIFLTALWIFGTLRKRKVAVTASMIVMFATICFTWYIYISSAKTFDHLLNIINYISENFISDLLNPQSRGSQVLEGLGIKGLGTFWHIIGRNIFYVTELLVIIGLLSSIFGKRKSFFDDEYNNVALYNLLIVIACIIIPNLAETFNMTRFYHLALFFLAPFCIMGGASVLKLLSKRKLKKRSLNLAIIFSVLIPFFLFQTGFVYEITKEECWSLPLSSYRFDALKLAKTGIIKESEVSGGLWLLQFRSVNEPVYTGIMSATIFDYTGVRNSFGLSLSSPVKEGCYVYLREVNIHYGIIFSFYGSTEGFNITQIVPSLNETDLIYSSGSCVIYVVP